MPSSQQFKDLFGYGTGVFRTADYSTDVYGNPVSHVSVASFNPGYCDGIYGPYYYGAEQEFAVELSFPDQGPLAHQVLGGALAFEWAVNDPAAEVVWTTDIYAGIVVHGGGKSGKVPDSIIVTCTCTPAYDALFGGLLVATEFYFDGGLIGIG